jgi:hypothetical protein
MASEAFKIGDYARGVEDGWLGKIVAFESDGMARMVGVDRLAMWIGGLTGDEALSPDDVRWVSPNDLVPA